MSDINATYTYTSLHKNLEKAVNDLRYEDFQDLTRMMEDCYEIEGFLNVPYKASVSYPCEIAQGLLYVYHPQFIFFCASFPGLYIINTTCCVDKSGRGILGFPTPDPTCHHPTRHPAGKIKC
jgi:hypothetical protein